MKPGRELDALIAEKVMGYNRCEPDPINNCTWQDKSGGYFTEPEEYSTDISAAWEVVGKFTNIDLCVGLAKVWYCNIRIFKEGSPEFVEYSSVRPTAPLAICDAALKAKND